MHREALQNFDLKFFLKFAVVFVLLYGCCLAVIGITTPGGTYAAFVDAYLNFPVWIRTSVLYGGKVLTALAGIPTKVVNNELTNLSDDAVLRMGWPCYGLMIKSFWIAFIVAHSDTLKNKIIWATSGILLIYIINCLRLMILMMGMVNDWSIGEKLSTTNHDLFNYASYIVIIGLILTYKKQYNKSFTAA